MGIGIVVESEMALLLKPALVLFGQQDGRCSGRKSAFEFRT